MAHILLVDDDPLLRRSLAFSLEQAEYRVSTVGTAEDALALVRRDPPDLILLDIGLPGIDGLTALRQLEREADIPVIFLTARRRELDQIVGLELGADDYVTKPFDPDVLIARIKVVLRRVKRQPTASVPAEPLTSGALVLDPAAHTFTIDGHLIDLAPREFALLHALMLEAGRVVSTDELLNRVWGAEFAGESQVVYVHIRRLREKLETNPDQPERIQTVRGIGYKFVG